jgi:hypothetical protein
MSITAMLHLAEGLCLMSTSHIESIQFSYLPCRHANANNVHDGMEIDFALKTLISSASRCRRLE